MKWKPEHADKATTLLGVAREAAKAKRDAEKAKAKFAFQQIREQDEARDQARWNAVPLQS